MLIGFSPRGRGRQATASSNQHLLVPHSYLGEAVNASRRSPQGIAANRPSSRMTLSCLSKAKMPIIAQMTGAEAARIVVACRAGAAGKNALYRDGRSVHAWASCRNRSYPR